MTNSKADIHLVYACMHIHAHVYFFPAIVHFIWTTNSILGESHHNPKYVCSEESPTDFNKTYS